MAKLKIKRPGRSVRRRTLLKQGRKKYFITKNAKGKITSKVSLNKSLSADARHRAKTRTVQGGFGQLGDRRVRKV